jgi:ribosome-associated heat shock protein Hsp15
MKDPAIGSGGGAARIDRWLFGVRLCKSRSLATEAVNGARVKPAHTVRPGDVVRFMRGAVEFECTVQAVPARRGPAAQAVHCYLESEASQVRRAEFAERSRLAVAFAPRPDERPDKHARRELRRLRGRD